MSVLAVPGSSRIAWLSELVVHKDILLVTRYALPVRYGICLSGSPTACIGELA